MQRGSVGAAGSKNNIGYNKPPPAPFCYNGNSRVRIHSAFCSGSLNMDRFGSRERSPNVGNVPISPSHCCKKSPSPTVQDIQDCSMCLSAYIQSLNTVCGTACRLSQCLSQVATDNGDSCVAKEAADIWEGIARAVGVTSATAKTHMISLLQEALAKQEYGEQIRKQEIIKVIHAVLIKFLNLHCQFSLSVLERFGCSMMEEHVGYYPEPRAYSPHLPPCQNQVRYIGNEWNLDLGRRWSMGNTDNYEKNSLSPFSLFANRRWSVPESYEDSMAEFRESHIGVYSPSVYASSCSASSDYKKNHGSRSTLHAHSVEDNRSPVQSRSVTPEKRNGQSLTSEELDNVIHLLCLPTMRFNSSLTSTPDKSEKRKNLQCVYENSERGRHYSASGESSGSGEEKRHDQFKDERNTLCTSLWPPTESVPGVTLTECLGEEEIPSTDNWTENGNPNISSGKFARDSPSRSSLPAAFLSRLVYSSTWNEEMPTVERGWPSFRRHSTDGPNFHPQQTFSSTKTKSYENLSNSESDSIKENVESNIHNLLWMNSFISSGNSSSNSQYSLFTKNT